MHGAHRPWLLVLPISTLGVLAGHRLAYAAAGVEGDADAVHGYMAHAPQAALVLAILALVGASFVERGSRVALWPFPALAPVGFVVQEHVERLTHTGSLPFLLDEPVFVIGVLVQVVVALAVWLIARLLVRIVGAPVGVQVILPRIPGALSARPVRRGATVRLLAGNGCRAPPPRVA